MKPGPVIPADIRFDSDGGAPYSPRFDDRYPSSKEGEFRARRMFLEGNGVPQRWRGRSRFVVLETGFGLGHNFLATWDAWLADPQACERLWFVSLDKHPPEQADLARAHDGSALSHLSDQLVAAWPPLTADLHRSSFENGRVELLLAFGDIAQVLPSLWLQADAVYLDGFAPACNPHMWARETLKILGRLAAPDASAATWNTDADVRRSLVSAGFSIETAPGDGAGPQATRARFAPVFAPRPPAGRVLRSWNGRQDRPRDAVIVGAGLAGAACAAALAREGLRCCVLDGASQAAQGASGNPAGLFHGVVHPDDGPHARLNRAAALRAERVYRPLIETGRVSGRLVGLLRLASAGASWSSLDAMRSKLGLPADHVQAWAAEAAAQRSGLPIDLPAWWYPGGGWLAPGALVRHWLSGPSIALRTGSQVVALRRAGARWQALDRHEQVLAEGDVLVLANADGALPLLGAPAWPVGRQRGQVTLVPRDATGLRAPRVPVAGGGYAIALPGGDVLCGATADDGDDEPALRVADHAANLDRLALLTGTRVTVDPATLAGRVAWRCLTDDRLPMVGGMPSGDSAGRARRQSREPGLFICAGLGSRGITWAPLLADLLATWVTGSPAPLPAELVDALDPARFAVRGLRRHGKP